MVVALKGCLFWLLLYLYLDGSGFDLGLIFTVTPQLKFLLKNLAGTPLTKKRHIQNSETQNPSHPVANTKDYHPPNN